MLKRLSALFLVLTLVCVCFSPALAASVYQPGDVMEDFTVTLSDKTTVSLSGLLKEKKAVLLNFWAPWCGPCRMEFPALEEAYAGFTDDIAVLALDVQQGDTAQIILGMKKALGLSLMPMGPDSARLFDRFQTGGIPTSVLVDRNGVICLLHVGAETDPEAWRNLFRFFAADDYETAVLDAFPAAKADPDESTYSFRVTDAAGNPVSGVLLQICDDETCGLLTTDENGTCGFSSVPYTWEVHVLTVPEGYNAPTETFYTALEGGELTIVLP